MILVSFPSLYGFMKREGERAALNLGASTVPILAGIALAILFPALMSGFLLLFANSFGSIWPRWDPDRSDVDLITIRIAALTAARCSFCARTADALSMMSL